MTGIIYKFTIIGNLKYLNHKPFYIGQHIMDISEEQFLRRDCYVYDGSGRLWVKFCKALRKKFPTCWRKLIKREVLYASETISQRGLDILEAYFIKKEKSHYSYKLGGCNILWGTANNFGSGSPMKDPMVANKVTRQLRGRKGAKRSKEGKRNISIAAKKSWKNAIERRKRVSIGVSLYMQNGGKERISKLKRGVKFTEDHKRKISLNHADFSGSKHPLYGSRFIWITDKIKNKRHDENLPIPEGWIRGMIQRGVLHLK